MATLCEEHDGLLWKTPSIIKRILHSGLQISAMSLVPMIF